MSLIFGILIGLLILVVLVAVHEMGHAIAAIKSGVVVQEFGIGFPPKAWAKRLKNGIVFSINWLPLGGFVKLQGEHDSADKPGDYGAASYLQKSFILFAGVTVNWVVAAVILSILAFTGLPKILPNQFFVQSDTTIIRNPVEVSSITSGSPADHAGLKAKDQLISINGIKVETSSQLIDLTKELQGQEIKLEFARDGKVNQIQLKLNSSDEAKHKGRLGVAPTQREFIKAGWSAPVTGVATTAQFSFATLVGVKDLVVNSSKGLVHKISGQEQASAELEEVSNSVAGPISIVGVIFPAAAKAGLTDLLFITAIISLTLAVMNILPIPALDGGRWATMTLFRLVKQPLTKEREESIQAAGFLVLMALIVVVTFVDLRKIF